MNKHTPGPWVVRPDLSIETGQSGITIAGLVDMPADAHLIAAAPAMYEALKAALDYYRGVFTGNTVTDKMMSSKLEQTLAQAGGK